MAMSAGTAEGEVMVEMNTTPLIDVMLVLLVLLIVTQTKPENIVIAVTPDEQMYYNNVPVDPQTMVRNFVDALRRAQASGKSLPEVHIRGDKNVRFEAIGRVILACQKAGIQKVGFITEPHSLEANSF